MSFLRERLPDPVSFFENEGLTLKGPGRWKTTACQFHGGSDSMRVNTGRGGWICMNCGVKGGDVLAYYMEAHGVDFVQAAKDLGAWQEDGRPSRLQPLPFIARDALSALATDAQLAAVAAANVANGVPLTDVDRRALLDAAARMQFIAKAVAT